MPDFVSEMLPDYGMRQRSNLSFNAVLNAHGRYETEQFVLRLSPKNHQVLSEFPPGVMKVGDAGYEGVRAMSTLLHETIHWWQHIGSTYGFLFSLIYPTQAHCTYTDLKNLSNKCGFKKSILLQSLALNKTEKVGFGTNTGLANTIVNNHFDLLAFRTFTYGPVAAQEISKSALFENVGHSFWMTYSHIINLLGTTVDSRFNALPDPKNWQNGFRDLSKNRVSGFYFKSPIDIWPLGALEIFEGQACLSQIQFLFHASGMRLSWNDIRELGLLYGVYEAAFKIFLELTESVYPDNPGNPIVGLFLLVCDISLNPGRGFPFDISPNFETFITDSHPGSRFCFLCRMINNNFSYMKSAIKDYSRQEYVELASELCKSIHEPDPITISERFSIWFSDTGLLQSLRKEYNTYKFEDGNFAIRHLFAHFLAFQEDKNKNPQFFCWPGVWMAGDRVGELAKNLFDKHGALFVDKEFDDGVFPRLLPNRSESDVYNAFSNFYHSSSTYGLTNQWIASPGPFKYDLGWLKPEATAAEMKLYLRDNFIQDYGLDPESAIIL